MRNLSRIKTATAVTILFLLPFFYNACGSGPLFEAGSPSGDGNQSAADPEDQTPIPVFVRPYSATAAQFRFIVCLVAIEFERVDGADHRISVTPTLIELNRNLTTLPSVVAPHETYLKTRLFAGPSCGSSAELVNAYGSFTTAAELALEFNGYREETGDRNPLELDIQLIVDQLLQARSNSELPTRATAVPGSF